MKLIYKTGEPILPGDYAILDNRRVIISSFISPEASEKNNNFVGIHVVDELSFAREILWVIPKERFIVASPDEIAISQKAQSRMSFLKRGGIRYLNTGESVCVGDVIALEKAFGLMSLCQICCVVYGEKPSGEVIAIDGTSIQNTGCLITDKIFGEINYSTIEFLDQGGFLSDDWAHVYFVRRGALCRPSRPKDPMLARLWDETFKE